MELEKIREILAELLQIDSQTITEDSFLVDDLGADSLDLFQLQMRLEQEYEIEMDDRPEERIFTAHDAVEASKQATRG